MNKLHVSIWYKWHIILKTSTRSSVILSTLFFLLILFISPPTFSFSSNESIPELKSLKGDWAFTTKWANPVTVYGEKDSGIVKVNFIKNYSLKGEENCKAVTLEIADEKLLASVIRCAEEHYFLCSGRIDGCGLPIDLGYGDVFTNVTKVKDGKLISEPEYKEIRYVLELGSNEIIYRYQEKDCFISYPHGCLINAFSWHDIGSYQLKKIQ